MIVVGAGVIKARRVLGCWSRGCDDLFGRTPGSIGGDDGRSVSTRSLCDFRERGILVAVLSGTMTVPVISATVGKFVKTS
jgi:hypothetical protein